MGTHFKHLAVKEEEPVLNLKNMGPDAALVTNEQGGKQSETAYRMDLIPPSVIFSLGEVLAYGAKRYAENNWKLIPAKDHFNHCLVHMMGWIAGDTSDDHAGHALCRMAMFYEMQRVEKVTSDLPHKTNG